MEARDFRGEQRAYRRNKWAVRRPRSRAYRLGCCRTWFERLLSRDLSVQASGFCNGFCRAVFVQGWVRRHHRRRHALVLPRRPNCCVGLAAAATTAAVYAARRFLRRASTLSIDPALFSADAIDAETREASEKAMAAAATMTPSYEIGPVAQRERRRAQYMAEHVAHFGNAEKPAQREDRKVSHESSSSPVGVSIFRPSSASNALRGVYLHIHGGGWYLGESAWQNDIRMCGLADRLSIAIVSVDYSLAPEHVWPRPYNDCIAAASWLVNNAKAEFGTDTLIIGGESAGGQLCALTCLGLRKALKLPSTAPFPYKAANLVYGCYDMGGTPSPQLPQALGLQLGGVGVVLEAGDPRPFRPARSEREPALLQVGGAGDDAARALHLWDRRRAD